MPFTKTLIQWYLQNKRDLPWRTTRNPYFIWLSEIILQQTRVDQGLNYYLKFIEKFPTVKDLAKAKESEVLKLWQGLGYYSRARNLHFSANYIMNELDGIFPTTYNSLLKLKGVGDYTASAIASICNNEATAVVDGNVYRVLSRYFGIKTPINSTKGIKEFKHIAQQFLDQNQPGDYNQAIMEFGARQCKPQNPSCEICPLQHSCVAYEKKVVASLPVKENKIKIRKRYFNYLILNDPFEQTSLSLRVKNDIWKGLYQFPLIESDKEISIDELLQHENFQKVCQYENISINAFHQTSTIHKLSHQHLYVKFWVVTTSKKIKNGVPWNAIDNYPVPILIHNFIRDFLTNS